MREDLNGGTGGAGASASWRWAVFEQLVDTEFDLKLSCQVAWLLQIVAGPVHEALLLGILPAGRAALKLFPG